MVITDLIMQIIIKLVPQNYTMHFGHVVFIKIRI